MDQLSEFAPQSRNTEFKELGEGHQEVREAPSPQYEKTSYYYRAHKPLTLIICDLPLCATNN